MSDRHEHAPPFDAAGIAAHRHLRCRLSGLRGFYMASQWVEPGGGIPAAVMSGRNAVQLMCADEKHHFAPNAKDGKDHAHPSLKLKRLG